MIRKALTIAGSDSGGGAGIQADLKTFQELGVYGMSVITAVTAQNTLGVQGVYPLTIEAVVEQMNSIGADLRPDAVKTGMLFSSELIEAAAEQFARLGWCRLVVDPVMIAKGGSALLKEDAVHAMRTRLLPIAQVITPNIPEAEVLTGRTIQRPEQKKDAAKRIYRMGAKHVVLKGGHDADGDHAVDLYYDGDMFVELSGRRISTRHTHGTGCTFSAAVAAQLAKGNSVIDAVRTAKSFIQAAIEHSLELGGGHGPTNHWAYRNGMTGRAQECERVQNDGGYEE